MTTADEVSILVRNMTSAELNEVIGMIKERRGNLNKELKRTLKLGDVVQFEGKGGAILEGKIVKVNQKRCKVDVDPFITWNVPHHMLTVVGLSLEDTVTV